MTILVVDDLRSPVGWEDNHGKYPPPIHIARNSEEAMLLLDGRHYHAIYLDFDLGEHKGKLDDTQVIAKALFDCALLGEAYPVDLIVAHSSNYWGRRIIVETLETVYTVVELPWAKTEGLIG